MKKAVRRFACAALASAVLFGSVFAAPPSDDYTLLYEDHFDQGKMNENDWYARTGDRFDGINIPEANSFDGSDLVVEFDKKEINGEEKYTGGGIISKNLFGYGYYECRSKLYGETGGLHSSFWTMGVDGVEGLPEKNQVIEIDGYEVDSGTPVIGAKEGISPSNIHYYVGEHISTGSTTGTVKYNPVDTSADYFTMGFEWLPNVIRFYLNDNLIREVKNPKFYAQQNIWLTALGSTYFDQADDSKLPGESRWDYVRFYGRDLPGVNIIGNNEFEYNIGTGKVTDKEVDLQSPVSWLENGDIGASRIVRSSDALSGSGMLEQGADSAYNVETSQRLQYIANGTYSLSAYVRNSGDNNAKIGVVSGEETFSIDVPAAGPAWTKVELNNINVTGNEAAVFIKSNGTGGQSLTVDNISFSQVGGNGNPSDFEKEPEEPQTRTFQYIGEIIVDNDIENSGYAEAGDWKASGLAGMVGKSRYLMVDQKDGYATWTPEIKTPGKYVILFSNITHQNSDPEATVEVVTKEGTKTVTIDQKNGKYDWINLGTYELDAGKDAYVKITPRGELPEGVEEMYIRTDAVKFIPEYAYKLNDILVKSLIMNVDTNYGFLDFESSKIDPYNPEVKPVLQNGEVFVPIRYITEQLGGTIGWNQESGQATITYNDKTTAITNNSDTLDVAGTQVKMPANAQVVYDRTYIPLEAVRDIFGLNVFYENGEKSGMFIIGEFDTLLDPATQSAQIQELKDSLFFE